MNIAPKKPETKIVNANGPAEILQQSNPGVNSLGENIAKQRKHLNQL